MSRTAIGGGGISSRRSQNDNLFDFAVLHSVSSVPSRGTGREQPFQNDLFCVEWDVRLLLNQSNRVRVSNLEMKKIEDQSQTGRVIVLVNHNRNP